MLLREKQTLHTTCNFNTVKTATATSNFAKTKTSCYSTHCNDFLYKFPHKQDHCYENPQGRKATNILTMYKIIDLGYTSFSVWFKN